MSDKKSTLNPKEERARLARVIKDSKARIEEELRRYKAAIVNLKVAAREYETMYSKYVAKPNPKVKEKLDVQEEKLQLAYSIRNQLSERITTLVAVISRSAAKIIEIVGVESGQGKAEAKNLEKYTQSIAKRVSDIEGAVIDTLPEVLAKPAVTEPAEAELELYDEEYSEEPAVEAEPKRAGATATSVSVAPVNIDVTPMIEKAIAAAMEQLTRGLGARIDSYLATLNLPSAAPVHAAVVAGGVSPELESHLLEGETELYEKLKTMCVAVDELIAGVAEASGTYLTLMQKIKEISDLQRQVNEMQRQTARDQQGVSVSQRLIADTQLEIVTSQKLVGDKQSEVSDTTSKLLESESALIATVESILASQTEIESSMKALLDREGAIVSAQQALSDTATKVEAAQRTVQEKQAELLASQRETMTQQRQLQREQRSVAERQAATEAPKTTRRSKKKATADETPAEPTVTVLAGEEA